MSNRRNFLHKSVLSVAGAAILPSLSLNAASQKTTGAEAPLQLGMAGFTFYRFNVDQCIAMMKRVGVTNLSLKDIHLPIAASDAQISEVLAKFKAGGINIYAVGVIYMKTKEQVDNAFAYAKKVGVSLIVGVPSYDLIAYTEEKVKEYDIRIAIHNHGPEDALYPAPADVYNRIKDLDARMGMCIDIGHALRAGADLPKVIKAYKERLFDLHIKDVTIAAKDGKAIEIGRGVIDFEKVIEALEKIKFNGMCSIEFEKDMNDPLPGIAESVGFFKGVMSV